MATRVFLGNNDSFTASSNNLQVFGASGGAETVKEVAGVTGLVTNADVERIELSGKLADYKFVTVAGTGFEIQTAAGALVTTVPSLNQNLTVAFADGSAPVIQTGGTAFTLGGVAVSTTAAAVIATSLNAADLSTVPAPGVTPVTTGLNLTPTVYNYTGTGGNDTFTARIFNNTNSLQTGDQITDTGANNKLVAYVGNSQNFAILPETTGVQNFFFRTQAPAVLDGADNFNTNPASTNNALPGSGILAGTLGDKGYLFNYAGASHDGYTQIDAGHISGASQFWSDQSRANLVIEDVVSNSDQTTIGFRDTDPGNVNYEVYFDPQHITNVGTSTLGSTLTIRLADVLNLKDYGLALTSLPYSAVKIHVGGTQAVPNGPVTGGVEVDVPVDFSTMTTYTQLASTIQSYLQTHNYPNITVSTLPAETAVFSIAVADQVTAGLINAQGSLAGTYNPILLQNSGPELLSLDGYIIKPGSSNPSGNVVQTSSPIPPASSNTLTSVNVILDNVARSDASGSGDLVIGDMSESGIQQFNVTVQHSSHIAQLASTNNVLQVVNVVNTPAASLASLGLNAAQETLADAGNLQIDKLYDVRVFDAHSMTGSLNLTAALTQNVTAKYLNLKDTAADPAADNSAPAYGNVISQAFDYELGGGTNKLNLFVNASNLDSGAAGTTTREDFVLNINTPVTSANTNNITLQVVDNNGNLVNGNGANWYINSSLNNNLHINATGPGNQTINKPGSGNVTITTGAGNDTIYTDNTGVDVTTGTKAKFVFNVTTDAGSHNINNLESAPNDTGYLLYNTKLAVSFKGFTASSTLLNTAGLVSDLQINQTLKSIINSDPVLSKLLVATDGPANSLVVTSLIDDLYNTLSTSDLKLTFTAPSALTVNDNTLLDSYYGPSVNHLLDIQNSLATLTGTTDYATSFAAYDANNAHTIVGAASAHISDNVINAGAGTSNVIVLGTGANSVERVAFTNFSTALATVDNIVNFDSSWIPQSGHVLIPGVGALYEKVVLNFVASDGLNPAETIIFDGRSVTLSAPAVQGVIPAIDVAHQFATLYSNPNWTVAQTGATQVTLTETTPGNIHGAAPALLPAITAASVTGTYTAGAVGFAVANVAPETAGAITYPGTTSGFTVTFNEAQTAAKPGGNITFAGVVTNFVAGDGAVTLTNDLIANTVAFGLAGWVVTPVGATGVHFQAAATGATAIGTAAAFQLGNDNIVGTLSGTVGTVDTFVAQYTPTVAAAVGPGHDILDFTSYHSVAVLENGILVAGSITPAVAQNYITLVESATVPGSYTITELNTGVDGIINANDVSVGVIGTANFGVSQAFHSANFLI